MRLLFVAPLESIHARRWISYFAQAGHDIHAINTSEREVELDSVSVRRFPITGAALPGLKYLTRYRRLVRRLRAHMEELAPDVVHIHWIGLYAMAAAQACRRPLVATPWGSDLLILPAQSFKRRMMVRTVLRRADLVTCDAYHLQDRLLEQGVPADRVKLVFFGTDTQLFHPDKADPELRAALDLPADCRLVVSTRPMDAIYDVGTLVRAVPQVVAEVPLARFVLVGGGDERDRLQQLARELGVAQYVRFPGRLPDAEFIASVASADLYVSTALSDGGLASSTAEAMACGIAPVITDFGDNPRWIENGQAGRLFPVRDHVRLAQLLVELLQHPAAARQMGQRAQAVIGERSNRSTEMQKMADLYTQIMARSTETPR